MQEITASEHKVKINLFKKGNSFFTIAIIVKRSRFTIRSIIKRFCNTESVINVLQCGCPEKLSERGKRKVDIVKKKSYQHFNTYRTSLSSLGKHVLNHLITSKQQLKQMLLTEWNTISAETIQKLIHSIPDAFKGHNKKIREDIQNTRLNIT